jgi:transposase
MLFPDNISNQICIDELALSKGELYTIVSSQNGFLKKKTIIATIKGTKSKEIINVLEKIPLETRKCVKEVTLDMAKNMESAVKMTFPEAKLVVDRFHVVKLVIDALQHIRIKLRWEELDKENQAIQEAKEKGIKYRQKVYSNGDSPKQLLARSRFILSKKEANWTENQKERAEILFDAYPELKKLYNHTLEFRNIYQAQNKDKAKSLLDQWLSKNKNLGRKEFNSVQRTIYYNSEKILNFFNNRSTNAFAESFNAKIKLFRANQRGVKNTPFFMFRLATLFA